jgi:hypothetical protein
MSGGHDGLCRVLHALAGAIFERHLPVKQLDPGSARPGIACLAQHGTQHLLIENKFSADLTENQPNGFSDCLLGDQTAVLLFACLLS